jgi:hypothetical protein
MREMSYNYLEILHNQEHVQKNLAMMFMDPKWGVYAKNIIGHGEKIKKQII